MHLGSPRKRFLAFGMGEPTHRRRRDEERQRRFVPQERSCEIDGRYVAHDSRAQAQARERFSIPVVGCRGKCQAGTVRATKGRLTEFIVGCRTVVGCERESDGSTKLKNKSVDARDLTPSF